MSLQDGVSEIWRCALLSILPTALAAAPGISPGVTDDSLLLGTDAPLDRFVELARRAGVQTAFGTFSFIDVDPFLADVGSAGQNPTRQQLIGALEAMQGIDLAGIGIAYSTTDRQALDQTLQIQIHTSRTVPLP